MASPTMPKRVDFGLVKKIGQFYYMRWHRAAGLRAAELTELPVEHDRRIEEWLPQSSFLKL